MNHREKSVAGNIEDKYGTKNPVKRMLMSNFLSTILLFCDKVKGEVENGIEIGCGEGMLVRHVKERTNIRFRACDFSQEIISKASSLHHNSGIEFFQRSIYDISNEAEGSDLVLCCEVLEHLEDPMIGLSKLREITRKFAIISVPNEPIWRIMNLTRGKYIRNLGNTPGHLNHWSPMAFSVLVNKYFKIINAKHPFPWTILLVK